jgi:Tfp pilus assembly protein PilO
VIYINKKVILDYFNIKAYTQKVTFIVCVLIGLMVFFNSLYLDSKMQEMDESAIQEHFDNMPEPITPPG